MEQFAALLYVPFPRLCCLRFHFRFARELHARPSTATKPTSANHINPGRTSSPSQINPIADGAMVSHAKDGAATVVVGNLSNA
ncbi:hypothetical protein [uncultured Corynebacterium sp.]|uniref:hypothetical protein n=1 Tax=uncultured Corynebacterium sp. TaxID=159447 RepID=UPI0025D49267|nr:hypothetical protein [uncultured Corynebacterium sp.]